MKNWIFLFSVIGSLGAIAPVQAAEKVILKYNVLQESISVAQLSTLSKTGEASPELHSYLDLVNKKPEELRQILNQSITITPTVLSSVLDSFAGKYLLNKLSEVIHSPSEKDSKEALRNALITSVNTNDDIRLIEVLENYPNPELQVEGDRLMELYQQVKAIAGNFSNLPF